jgi:20S proteasome subunit beta 5
MSKYVVSSEESKLPKELSQNFQFQLPNTARPVDFVQELRDSKQPTSKVANFDKGTTTLGFSFKEGVIIAVDSRASQGAFEASNTVRKVIEINDRLLGTMAGGAADCQYWEEYLAMQVKLYELKYGEELTVAAASQLFSNILYRYRGYGLSVGTMIAGSDSKGVQMFYCDNDGIRVAGNLFAVGSGGTYAYGVLDSYYKHDMTLEEAVALGKRAISEATYMDSGSGGVVRVYHVFQGGWRILADYVDNSELIWEHRKANGVPPMPPKYL